MNLLFVCTGNTCRSPMAEAIFNSMNIPGSSAKSAGIYAEPGMAASYDAIEVCNDNGIDLRSHRSRLLTKALCDEADCIICMTESHKKTILSAGISKEKLFVLGSGISDPYGCGIAAYESAFSEIRDAICRLLPLIRIYTIVPFSPELIDELVNIEKTCFSEPWSAQAFKDSSNAGTEFVICISNGKVIGYGGVSKILDEAYITNIAVLPEYRRIGVGQTILNHLIKSCRKARSSFISLEVRESNIAARTLYRQNGFEEVGTRRGFYSAPKEDAVLMTRRFEYETVSN